MGSIFVDGFVFFLQIVPFYGFTCVHSGTIVAKIQKKRQGPDARFSEKRLLHIFKHPVTGTTLHLRQRKHNMKHLVLLSAFFSLGLMTQAQELMPWKLKLNQGEKITSVTIGKTFMTQQVMDQTMEIKMDMQVADSLHVKSAQAGGYQINKKTTRMKLDMDMMNQHKLIDSDNPDDLQAEGGEKIKEKIDAVVEATISEKAAIQVTGGSIKADEGGFANMMMTNNDSSAIAEYFLPSPGKAIKKGEQWSTSVSNSGNLVETVYTFEGLEGSVAIISFTLKTKMTGTTTSNNMEVKMEIRTEGKGTIRLQTTTGIVMEKNVVTNMTGSSQVMGMDIPITGTVTSSFKVVKS